MSTGYDLVLSGPMGSLDAYVRKVEQIPMLNEAEERRLAERYRRHNDLEAAFQLVVSNLRLVVHVARQYKGYGLPQEDLVQEGNIGLMKAVKRFDPSRGVRLFKYALLWIRAEIHDYVLRNWRIVRVATNRAKRKLFYKLRRTKQRLEWLNDAEADRIAEELDVPRDDVVEMDMRLYAKDASFDADVDGGDEDAAPAPAAYLPDFRFDPGRVVADENWQDWAKERLGEAMRALDVRSRDIVMRRWLSDDKATLHELADEYGVSAERVRQIENAAIKKLRAKMEEPAERYARVESRPGPAGAPA